MDFDFTDEQEQLRDAVRRWVDKGYGFARRRELVAKGGFSREAYAEMAGLGLPALCIAEEDGGLGLGAVEAMVVMEELGRGLVLEPLGQTLVASAMLSSCVDADVRAAWLPKIAAGQALMVLAQQERAARYRLDRCAATATATTSASGGFHVSGAKSLVSAGDHADAFLVPALLDGHMAVFIVARDAAGVHTRGYGTQDGSRAAELTLRDAPATLVTRDGLAALEYGVDVGIAALCAEAVGAMEQTLAMTVEYLRTRRQFGVAIASFQALRHRVADMKMQLELARSMSYYASLKLDAPPDERRRALSRAKVQLGTAMRFVGQQAVQLHGGIGVTDEYHVSHYFKRLTQMEMTFGDTMHHLGEVSSRMPDRAGVFA